MRSEPARAVPSATSAPSRGPHADGPLATFLADVLQGLDGRPRTLPCKYLYDARGSALFEQICELPAYYPTRTELGILRDHAAEVAEHLGPRCLLVEYGAGAGIKTRLLLDALRRPAAYVPIEISAATLATTAQILADRFPELEVLPLCADYTAEHALPAPRRPVRRRAAFFPGSTIGNLDPGEAQDFLVHVARQMGPGGALVIGVDLRKDPAILAAAYDDPAGVTAAFNRNLLRRLQRELGARLDPEGFRHRAIWNPEASRMEMHLESRADQVIEVVGHPIDLHAGETIHTENSYKYTIEGFTDLARGAGWQPRAVWTDSRRLFSVHQLTVAGPDG